MAGAEATVQGDEDVQQLSSGGLIELDFDKDDNGLQLRGSYSWLRFAGHSSDARPYVVGLCHRI